MLNGKELRSLIFMAVAVVMGIIMCITSICSGNIFGIMVSIVLMALLCVGFGYLYCKHEDKIFAPKPKVEVKSATIEDFEKILKESTATEVSMGEGAEVEAVENDS